MRIDKYLYEILDDYKNASSEKEKTEVFKDFCSSLWKNKNKRRVYNRTIKFKVRSDLLKSEIGRIFNTWSEVDYISYKSMTKDTDWCSLLRQKINNLYTRYCDEEVILKKDYMDLLRTPRKLYYRWINGEEINTEELTMIIDNSINKANKLKDTYKKEKIHLSWNEYKKLIETFLKKIFDRCRLIEDYEIENLTNEQINKTNKYIYDFFNEDRLYIKYVCKSLEGEMMMWQKKHYQVRQHQQYKRCKKCGRMIEKSHNRIQYCNDCKREMELERYKKYNKKRSNHN